MITSLQNEMLAKLKELKLISKKTEESLENSGLSIADLYKKQLFDNNIKSTMEAIEALLRNEPSERPILRLKREIPDSYTNIKKIKETQAGKLNSEKLDSIQSLMSYLEHNYERL